MRAGRSILPLRRKGSRQLSTGNLRKDSDPFQIHFTSATVFPGLINSHDHLDFNCFSILGQRKFTNYSEWGTHIHQIYKEQIDAILKFHKTSVLSGEFIRIYWRELLRWSIMESG